MILAELALLETLPVESAGASSWSRAGGMLMVCEPLSGCSLSSSPPHPDPREHRAAG